MQPATRKAFCALFNTTREAVEFEQSMLSIGRSFIPACACDVLDGADGTPEYWAWLIESVESDADMDAGDLETDFRRSFQ
ncbi:MAG: hypothetical protein E6Q97_07820 [Desulfurellales bacterium]|nr:MAG: hypothetical protein E6Q97_07820 [Desulfurellales bacterium]